MFQYIVVYRTLIGVWYPSMECTSTYQYVLVCTILSRFQIIYQNSYCCKLSNHWLFHSLEHTLTHPSPSSPDLPIAFQFRWGDIYDSINPSHNSNLKKAALALASNVDFQNNFVKRYKLLHFDQKFLHFWKRACRAFLGTEKATELFLSFLDRSRCAYNCRRHLPRTWTWN
jgi:hypothetical protein